MHRRASVLFLGLFAVSAALQGAAACSNTDATPPGADSGPPPSTDSAVPDTGNPLGQGCSGSPPVMTVTGPSGDQIPGDWSCYGPDASFLFVPSPSSPPSPFDDGGVDADDGSDSSDAEIPDTALPPPDTGTDAPIVDANPPPPDSSVPPDAAPPPDAGPYTYALSLTDFLTSVPPVGATVDITWGGSSLGAKAYTGTVDDAGLLFFPTPPAGQQLALGRHRPSARTDDV